MPKALMWKPDAAIPEYLQADLKSYGWTIDVCEGLLELLRLVESNGYDIVILNASHLNVGIHTLIGAIKALEKSPLILLNLPETDGDLSSALMTLEYPVIRGSLTTSKLLEVAKKVAR